MQKNKIVAFGLFLIFGFQGVCYFMFAGHFDSPSSQKINLALMIKRNQTLQTELEFLKASPKKPQANHLDRQIASVQNLKQIDLTQFYFSQIEGFKKNKDKVELLKMIHKIQDNGVDKETAARAEFEKLTFLCDQKMSLDCTTSVEAMVVQFPESNWTAKTLLFLSHKYFENNKIDEAKALLKIIKNDFKTYKEFAIDVKELNNKKL